MTRTADADFKIRILARSPLFAAAAEDDLAELARVSRLVAVSRGKAFAATGGAGASIFTIQSGVAAELYAGGGDERAMLVALAGPGDIAGAAGAIAPRSGDGDAHRRRIEALSDISALATPVGDLLRLCRRNAELSLGLAEIIAAQGDALAALFSAATHHTLEMRLAAFVGKVASLSPGEDWDPVTNIGRLSQSSIAAMLGVSREHVNRTFAMWERSGLIFQNKSGDLLVQNARRMHALASAPHQRGGGERHEDWLWEIDAHLDRGLNQTALHLALEAAKRAPKDVRYAHRAVLATARLGALSEALALLDKHKLGRDLADEDLATLRPRLERDLAFANSDAAPDSALLAKSAADYAKVYAKTGGFYSGVNAAAGAAMTGDLAKAKSIAASVAGVIASQNAASDITEDDDDDDIDTDNYWRRTTLAECKMLEGDALAAASLFEAASNAADATPGKKATTRKQLKRLAAPLALDPDWIDRVAPQPQCLFFSGPLAPSEDAGELPTDAVLEALDDLLADRSIGWACGALASGADIVIAEALIEAGVSLNAYLPLPPADFLKSSVKDGGEDWRARFVACMQAADSIEWSRRAPAPCNASYRLGAEVAMGKTIRQAAQLETGAVGFFAVQRNRQAAESLSVANAERWKARGLDHVVVAGEWPARPKVETAKAEACALLFALVVFHPDGVEPPPGMQPAADHRIRSKGLELFLFKRLEDAAAEARAIDARDGGGAFSIWLDAGVFDLETLYKKPADAVARLVAAACKPVTEPGRIYASEAFACAAPLNPAVTASFEYVGYAPTREKLDPCALYLARF